jgi:hypothetical protein
VRERREERGEERGEMEDDREGRRGEEEEAGISRAQINFKILGLSAEKIHAPPSPQVPIYLG